MSNESTSTEPQPLFAKKPKPAGEKKEGGNSKTGLIVGICCGAGAFIILIVVLIVVLVVNGGGNTVSCENTKDYGNGNTQKGGVKVSFDKEDKLTGIYAWEETHTDEVISESEWESFEKDSQNYDKDKYLKYEVSKLDDHNIRLEFDLKLTDEHKKTYSSPEAARKELKAQGFTCEE